MTGMNLKRSIANPPARDIGNQTIQNKVVSKTIQFSLFTTNENAVWAANNQLRKESYPFPIISFPVNRNNFKFQPGDVFKWNYAKYGIVDLICRVLTVQEDSLNSEKIILYLIEDLYSVANTITEYTNPSNDAQPIPDYTIVDFSDQNVYEAPYVLTTNFEIIPLAARASSLDLGMVVYMSMDGGSSYTKVDQENNIQAFGTLTQDYPLTNPIDNKIGILIDFSTTDVDNIDTITLAELFAGNNNMGIIENEIISFQTITPVSGTIYKLTNVIRGRYGTQQEVHLTGKDFWFINKHIGLVNHSEISPGATRLFKLLPYNQKYTGSLADATALSITLSGKAQTPYIPINFCAGGVSFSARYSTDVILTWSPRKRGEGAGIGVPGTILAETDYEGLFDIEVWVSSVLVRTTTDINAITWTYTSAMNISDNGSLASEIEFKITNHRTDNGITFTSDKVSVITKLII